MKRMRTNYRHPKSKTNNYQNKSEWDANWRGIITVYTHFIFHSFLTATHSFNLFRAHNATSFNRPNKFHKNSYQTVLKHKFHIESYRNWPKWEGLALVPGMFVRAKSHISFSSLFFGCFLFGRHKGIKLHGRIW